MHIHASSALHNPVTLTFDLTTSGSMHADYLPRNWTTVTANISRQSRWDDSSDVNTALVCLYLLSTMQKENGLSYYCKLVPWWEPATANRSQAGSTDYYMERTMEAQVSG